MYKEYGSLSASNKQDLLLFGQAFVSLILQMALVGYQIMRFIGGYYNLPSLQAFALIYFYYVNDAFSLVSPISLLLICKFIRKDYIGFITGKRETPKNTQSWT
uniref:Uncharacterized protein n=1 Tax=Panagrolaimus sp. PS1159 TaxID=55785 RepID=A0AC35F9I3_9BILA